MTFLSRKLQDDATDHVHDISELKQLQREVKAAGCPPIMWWKLLVVGVHFHGGGMWIKLAAKVLLNEPWTYKQKVSRARETSWWKHSGTCFISMGTSRLILTVEVLVWLGKEKGKWWKPPEWNLWSEESERLLKTDSPLKITKPHSSLHKHWDCHLEK